MQNFRKLTTDILIIGGGGTAATAALSANSLGAEVTVVSKETSFVGGATIQSGGGVSTINDPNDSPEKFFNDIMKSGGYLNNPKLARIMAERARPSLLKLEKYGLLLDRANASTLRRVSRVEGNTYPRAYQDRRENLGWCQGLSIALARSGVKFYPEVMITKLLVSQSQVVGALGLSLTTGEYLVFNAKAVLLATGGLGQLYEVTTNAKTLTGDGYAMAWDAGAKLVDMEMVQFLPLAFPYPKSRKGVMIGMCSLFGPNVKMYNRLGERYMYKYDPERLEYTTRDTAARANFTEISEGRGTEKGAVIVDPTGNDPSQLQEYRSATPIAYKRLEDVFGADAANWKKTFEAMPSQHHEMGGIMIDENCKTSVPGLFSAGEASGGVQGGNRIGGNGLGEAITFGDLAGQSMAQWIRDKRLIPPDTAEIEDEIGQLEAMFNAKPKDGIRPFQIIEKIQKTMWSYLGPVRDKDGMEKAIATLQNIQENDLPILYLGSHHVKYNQERIEAAELRLMVKTALIVARSALAREESRAAHFRTDFPISNDKEWLKNIVIDKSKDEDVTISYKPVLVG